MFQNNLLMGAAAASGGGASLVSVGNSALYDSANSEYLSRTFGTPDSTKKGTFRTLLQLAGGTGAYRAIFSAGTDGNNWLAIRLDSSEKLQVISYVGGAVKLNKITSMVLRDNLSFYDIVCRFDSANATPSNRFILEINGVTITDFSTDTGLTLNSRIWLAEASLSTVIGKHGGVNLHYGDFYLAETCWLDNNLEPASSFGEFDTTGLYWTPKSSTEIKALTFGTNGFYLDNTTNAQTDASGEGNNFTNNNTVVTSTNTPTNIKPLLNPLNSSTNTTLSNGNQSFVNSAANNIAFGTIPLPSTGKWYFEYKLNNASSSSIVHVIGLMKLGDPAGWTSGLSSGFSDFSSCYLAAAQQIWQDGSLLNSPSTGAGSINDILSLAVDLDNTKMWIGYNNSFYNASGGTDGNPATGANAMSTKNFSDNYGIIIGLFSSRGTIQFDTDDFSYTPPSGYLALNSTNLKATTTRTASDTTKYFDTILYEGNGAGQRVGQFQPFGNAFTVGNGALFAYENNEILKRTNSSGGNETKWTFSTWIKFNDLSAQIIMGSNAPTISPALWVSGNDLYFTLYNGNFYSGGGSYVMNLITDLKLYDTSQWMHLVAKYDSTPSTPSSSSIALYLNGVQITDFSTESYPSQNQVAGWNSANEMIIGTAYNSNLTTQNLRAYLAETVNIDGLALGPDSFGQTDTSTNRWIPKDVSGLTFGTNGFYLNYANSSDVGNDVSGNNNDWTNVNTVTQSTDSPTTNFAVLDATQTTWGGAVTLSAGNLTAEGTTTTLTNNITSTLTMYSGKYVYAFKPDSVLNLEGQAGIVNDACYIARSNNLQETTVGTWSAEFNGVASQFSINQNGTRSTVTPNSNYETGDYIIVALDVDNLLVWLGHYDASTDTTKWYNSVAVDWTGNPATGTGGSRIYGNWFKFSVALYSGRGGVADFGQNSLLSNIDIPTGFNYLTQDNITSSDQFISAFSWIKNRDATDNHMLFDRVRGINKDLHSNDTSAQVTNVETVQSFLAGGVQVGNDVEVNTANESYVLWNWMMEATGSGSSNEDGSINTIATLVDTTLGLSIGTYTGTGSNATIGHGLGVAPEMVIVKRTNTTGGWYVLHKSLGGGKFLNLDGSAAATTSAGPWNNTLPTSSVFSLGTGTSTNASSGTFMYMAFAPSQFISIGSYEGNGNADGTFASLLNSLGIPIKPVWALFKNADNGTSGSAWSQEDTARSPINVMDKVLTPNENYAEGNWADMDFVTGGIKQRGTNLVVNESGSTIIYMAIGTPIIDTDGRIIAGR